MQNVVFSRIPLFAVTKPLDELSHSAVNESPQQARRRQRLAVLAPLLPLLLRLAAQVWEKEVGMDRAEAESTKPVLNPANHSPSRLSKK